MKHSKYISRNRINLNRPLPEPKSVSEIKQPPPPVSPTKKFFQSVMEINTRNGVKVASVTTPTTGSKNIPTVDKPIADAVKWLQANHYTVLPERTSMPGNPIEDIAVVVGYSGANDARYRANKFAMDRMLHANPRPKAFIFVEYVNPGEESHYSNLENEGWDKVIVIKIDEKSENVWQKEAFWSVGGRYAFDVLGVKKCIFLDADSTYEDNSWVYYINKCLDQYEIIQAFEAFYYADQPDYNKANYAPYGVRVSTAWALKHNARHGAPGCCYACTDKFFKEVLDNHWPYSSRGSGDAVLWLFLKGVKATYDFPMHFDFRISDKYGVLRNVDIGYAPLLVIHYNHGPLFARMHGSRDYLMRKCNTYPGSDVVATEEGVLQWSDTAPGELMKETTKILFDLNNKYQRIGKQLPVSELKAATIDVRKRVYGYIDSQHPLIITTYADDSISDVAILQMKHKLAVLCTEPHRFLVFSNREIKNVETVVIKDLPTFCCAYIWKRLMVFNYNYGPDTSVLFIDPEVNLRGKFMVNQCPKDHIFMARPYILAKNFGHCNWNSSMMFFRNINGLFERYRKDLTQAGDKHPEYQFLDPSDYINAFAHFNGYSVRNIISHFDYAYVGQTFYRSMIEMSDFVLKDQ